jgi:hypothetical protein
MEDMIDTVHRVQRPFVDVFIDGLFFEDADYPLTYVSMPNMVLPLLKDQEVWVYFNQQNHRYPVLWKLVEKFGEDVDFLKERFEFALSGGVVVMPDVEPTKTVFKVSDSMWVISTDSYSVMHYGDSCVLMNAGGVFANAEAMGVVVNELKLDVLEKLEAKIAELALKVDGDVGFEVGGSLGVDVSGTVDITSGGCTINNVLKVK